MDSTEHEIDLFEFAELAQAAPPDPVAPAVPAVPAPKFNRIAMEQTALAFLLSLHPDAVARNVPTRNAKYRATAGAFWKHARTRGSIVTRTVLSHLAKRHTTSSESRVVLSGKDLVREPAGLDLDLADAFQNVVFDAHLD